MTAKQKAAKQAAKNIKPKKPKKPRSRLRGKWGRASSTAPSWHIVASREAAKRRKKKAEASTTPKPTRKPGTGKSTLGPETVKIEEAVAGPFDKAPIRKSPKKTRRGSPSGFTAKIGAISRTAPKAWKESTKKKVKSTPKKTKKKTSVTTKQINPFGVYKGGKIPGVKSKKRK